MEQFKVNEDNRKKRAPSPPQLEARERLSIESSDNDDDALSLSESSSSSLEILPHPKSSSVSSKKPSCVRKDNQPEMRGKPEASATTTTNNNTDIVKHSSSSVIRMDRNRNYNHDSDDDNSSDDELLQSSQTFVVSKKRTATTIATSTGSEHSSNPTAWSQFSLNRSMSVASSTSTTSSTNTVAASQKKESREEIKARKKLETEGRKRLEKLAKARKREEEQQERERKKLEIQSTRKRQIEETKQAAGKFAHQEIVILMDPLVFQNSEYALVDALEEDFLLQEYPSALTCTRAIQWVRRDYLQGGAQEAWNRLQSNDHDQHNEHLPYCMLILEPDDFIPLLQRPDRGHDEEDQDDFPALGTWLDSLKARWRHVWQTTKEPRMILLLHRVSEDLDRKWIDHRHRMSAYSSSLPTEFEFQDAIQWLLIQFQVECIQCSTIEMMQGNVHKLTRGLAEAPYANPVTELECIKKIKQDHSTINNDNPFNRARDTWLRQLQQVNGLSEPMARNVVQRYPTMQSLMDAYQQEKENPSRVLAGLFHENKSMVKLSETVHRILTSTDPKEILS